MRYNTQPYGRLPLAGDDVYLSAQGEARLVGWLGNSTLPLAPRLAYNLQPYGRILMEEDILYLVGRGEARLTGWLHLGADYSLSLRSAASLSGRGILALGAAVKGFCAGVLRGSAWGMGMLHLDCRTIQALTGSATLGADVGLTAAAAGDLTGSAHLGANLYQIAVFASGLAGTVHLGADLSLTPRAYATLVGYANLWDVVQSTAVLRDPIPPGATLTMDADNYNLTLKQGADIRDVISWHSGDWIHIQRGTISLTLSGVGNHYHWEVFYHAQYL